MVMLAPVFSRRELFSLLKIVFILWVSSLLLFLVPFPDLENTDMSYWYVVSLLIEFLIGAIVGFVADVMVSATELAGSIMDTQAGLAIAAVLDPARGAQITVMSQLLKWCSMIIFLLLDGHHLVLSAIVKSFYILPVGSMPDLSGAAEFTVNLAKVIFYLGAQLAAPIILVVFLVDFGFSILNKIAEQVNVFQLGFQVKPIVSLIVFVLVAPGLLHIILGILERTSEQLFMLFGTF